MLRSLLRGARLAGTLVGALTAAGGLYVAASEERRTAVQRGARLIRYCAPIVYDYAVTLARVEAELGAESPGALAARSATHSRAAVALLALAEANGGVFIKFAQALSTNRYSLPDEVTSVLARAQDRAPPRPWSEVAAVFAEDHGAPASAVFASIEEAPVAAASLAQVHRAVTREGARVAVKIQYPRLRREAAADLSAIRLAAAALELMWPALGYSWLLPELEASLRAELNFLQEARNGERCAAMLASSGLASRVHVPAVHRALSSERVLVMEWIEGCRVDDLAGLARLGAPPAAVAAAVVRTFAEMYFIHGFVHCDPHPGNLMVRAAPGGGG